MAKLAFFAKMSMTAGEGAIAKATGTLLGR